MSMENIKEEMEMGYNDLGNSSRVRVPSPVGETPPMVLRNNNTNNNVNIFRECLKNHVVNNGGHALDGCCEFLPTRPEGSIDALKCAACNCHHNFHRKGAPLPPIVVAVDALVPTTIIPAGDGYPPYNTHCHQTTPPPQYAMYHIPRGLLHVTAATPTSGGPSGLGLISPARGGSGGDAMDHDNGCIGSSSNSMKRSRTKFTPELKEKMKAFAESLDWRIQKQNDVVVQEFCNENSVKRQVLKVWMHNNKHTIGKKP